MVEVGIFQIFLLPLQSVMQNLKNIQDMKTTTATQNDKIVAYYRVSTKRQSLGLDAQQKAVRKYAEANGLQIVAEVQEKESGKELNRPELNFAMATARKERAALVVAKADRLSRDLSFAAAVYFNSGIKVISLDLPELASENAAIFGMWFGMAQQELKIQHDRRRLAIDEIRAKLDRGEVYISKRSGRRITSMSEYGNPNPKFTAEMREKAANKRREDANNDPSNLAAAAELKRYFEGAAKRNLSAAARHLNEKQLYTPRGVFHDAKSVKLLIARYGI